MTREAPDRILEWLTKNKGFHPIGKIAVDNNKWKYLKNDVERVLQKLEKDNYVYKRNGEYTFTYDGLYFYKSGGYEKQREREQLKANISYRVNLALRVGGWGALASAGILLLIFFHDILPFLRKLFCFCY